MKKKVLFISAANSIHTVRWVNSLSEKFEIHLAFCSNHKPNIDNINSNIILHELKFKSPLGYYFNCSKLKKIYKKIKPDVVNVHYASGYGTLSRISRIPNTLLSIWGSDVYDFPNESFFKRLILKKNVLHAKCIASTSNVMANELQKQFPKLNKKIYITPFGVDTNKFKKINVERNYQDFNIGNVKTLEEKYGIKYLILGVDKLIKKLKQNSELELAQSIKLYIYGDGSQKQQLQELIDGKNLSNNVFLMGKISNNEVPSKLNQLDVFCASSNSESFGVAVVEAMACQLPVIASKVDGFCEVMDDNKTGILVEKEDSDAICDALEKMLRDKNKRFEYGKNGRDKVLKYYDWKNNVEYMEKIYLDMIEEK